MLTALRTWGAGSRKKVLMLVNKQSGTTWKVIDYDSTTGRTTLENTEGMHIHPIPKERENELYSVLWR